MGSAEEAVAFEPRTAPTHYKERPRLQLHDRRQLPDVAGRPGDTWRMSQSDLPEFDRAQLHAIEVLRGGGAVVVTNPSPMTYGVVARDPRAVNLLKGRPVNQPVGIPAGT